MKDQTIVISTRSIVFTIFFLIGLFILTMIKDVVVAVLLSIIIMAAMNPGVRWLERRKIPRPFGILFLYILLLSFIGFMIAVIVPPITKEFTNFVKTFPIPQLSSEFWEFKQFTTLDPQSLSTFFNQIGDSVNSVIGVVTTTFSGILFVFTMLVMGFYLLLDRPQLHKKLVWFSETEKDELLAKEFLDRLEKELGSWVRGQLLLMFVIGGLTYLVLTLLGVPYAVPLAVLAGLLEILPNLGPTIAAFPGIFVAFLLVNPTIALFTAISYIVIQQLENNVIVPRIMKASVDVDALTSIITILVGFRLGGVMGALLSIPIFITLRIGFNMWKREQK